MAWVGVITNAGNEMLAQISGGAHTLTLTAVTVGSGTRPEVNLRTATALIDQKDTGSIASREDITNGVRIRLRIGPHPTTSYVAHEIGIWGAIDGGLSRLFSIHQDSASGMPVPTEADSPEFFFDLIVAISMSDTGSLVVNITPGIYATEADLQALDDKVGDIYSLSVADLLNKT